MTRPALGKGATGLRRDRRRREGTRPRPAEKIAAARAGRDQRWTRRRQLRRITKLRRCHNCGHSTTAAESGPTVGVITNPDGSRSAAYGGLTTCGSVWVCPVCAGKIATRRADDLATVMRAVDDAGGSAFMLTLTMRHDRGDRLGLSREDRSRRAELEDRAAMRDVAEANGWDVDERAAEAEEIELADIHSREGVWDVLGYAWSSVTSGSVWTKDAESFGGLLGWARAVEATWSERNGWHLHIHVLLCFGEQVSADLVAASVGARMFGRWRRALERKGYSASEEHGWDLRRAQLGDGDLADYFVKMAHEVTSGHRKESTGSRGGRTPMQLLGEAVDTYEVDALARWWEWERASEGRRQLTLVHRPARPARLRQARARGHRRGDRRGGPGRGRPPWPHLRRLGLATHNAPRTRAAGRRRARRARRRPTLARMPRPHLDRSDTVARAATRDHPAPWLAH